jgi:rod shape determining protein RodA
MELARFPLRRLAWRLAEGIDSTLLVLLLTLSMVGLAVLYSASYDVPGRVAAQLANLAVALVAMWIVAQVPPQTMMRFAVPAYVVGLAFLVAVALAGDVVNGARRWLHVGVTRFQPSEMMKLALPLMLAWYFHKNESTLRLREYFVAGLLLLVPLGLILRQPDLGTAGLVGTAGFFIIFFAGMSWRVMGAVGAAGAAAVPLLWPFLHDYQRRRILTLLDPSSDPLGAGYHIIQSTIAVGSGGLAGKGWLNGTQSHLEFIPERHTDFIFAVYSEEFGLYPARGARAHNRRRGGDAFRAPARRVHRPAVLRVRLRKHGHGLGHPARGRGPAAISFLRRDRAPHAIHRRRHPDGHPAPSQARPDVVSAKQQSLELVLAW